MSTSHDHWQDSTKTYADTIWVPLVIKIAFNTEVLCPSKVLRQHKSLTDHNLTVLSDELVSTHCVIKIYYYIYNYYSLGIDYSLQNQSFQIEPKLFLKLDNDVLIMFPKWFWSIILSVTTMSILVFSQNSNFYPEL